MSYMYGKLMQMTVKTSSKRRSERAAVIRAEQLGLQSQEMQVHVIKYMEVGENLKASCSNVKLLQSTLFARNSSGVYAKAGNMVLDGLPN
ncbi:hypothetical protein PI124_g12244 [Phytophthora idaei]|nr:hypothetical protein PI125_g17213 [Phytophthora idaei]KAG3150859.1 hypothetical protein PI126_g11281 [Phytophthora idaei]KAG3242928.1 hypothetical protein PI124_g12244 [Phytophthora idaei]